MEKKVKRMPYGISRFEQAREENMYFVDKSMYLPVLERACHFLIFNRPKRFGKSMFLSMMRYYYDMGMQDRFEALFDGMWIKEHPTELKGKFQVIYFDFSQATAGYRKYESWFHCYCSNMLISFAGTYADYYDDGFEEEVKKMYPDSASQLRYICYEAHRKSIPLYLMIDEYDDFTHEVLYEEGQAVYQALEEEAHFYCQIFKLYKPNFSRIMMTGVSPVTLNDLTSGFNIAINISMDPRFNAMLGFTETDLRQMIQYYKDAGMIEAEEDDIIGEMRPWYDSYCFSEDSYGKDPTVYNSDMVIYYMSHLVERGCPPDDNLNVNARMEYRKIKRLVKLDRMGADKKRLVEEIARKGYVYDTVNSSFPAESIYDEENFVSMLYYYGMLTITGVKGALWRLGIPNNNMRRQYYGYMTDDYELMKRGRGRIDFSSLDNDFYDLAVSGNWRLVIEDIVAEYAKLSDVSGFIEDENSAQGFVMCALSRCPYYVLAPVVEQSHTCCDFYLLPDKTRYEATAHSYIIVMKHLAANAGEEAAESQWQEALSQIRRYATDRKVETMRQGTQLHLIIMQMRAYQLLRLEEV